MVVGFADAVDVAHHDHDVDRHARNQLRQLVEIGIDGLVASLQNLRQDFPVQPGPRLAQHGLKIVARIFLVTLDQLEPFVGRALNRRTVRARRREHDFCHSGPRLVSGSTRHVCPCSRTTLSPPSSVSHGQTFWLACQP